MSASSFNSQCVACPRLARFLSELRRQYPDYHNLPVAPFGARKPRLLIVGLAPGMHGANATGRPFTGDYSGLLLYQTLHKFGFASKPSSDSADDDLKLIDCCITNAVKCLPPQNKPNSDEIKQCNHYLAAEINALPDGAILIALGSIAHDAILRAMALKKKDYKFGHNIEYSLDNGMTLIDSYHCSRYNTQTKRLTPEMFEAVFARVRNILG